MFTEDIPSCDSICKYQTKTDVSSSWVAETQAVCRVMEDRDIRRGGRGEIVRFTCMEQIHGNGMHTCVFYMWHIQSPMTKIDPHGKATKHGKVF